ncbi:type I-B CRISPR-associated endonuclease Cas1b [uncultured Microscilla sp.]|uniref:type I-B CRISPR-associated endonuclease Cas1b n=1 Tax=uncultured Microscilla sp. TaxID=432653 RepID=UPI00261226C3|nr:type I-B CRISPR-associated endonuclease Cas1b [uncultured Microscilla sp.]
MKKSYYLFNAGRLEREDNTLKFTIRDKEGEPLKTRFLPVEGVKVLYMLGSLDANSALYNFLGKHQVTVHFFDYYGHYTGSFMPRDYLLAGQVQINQTNHYQQSHKRMLLASRFVEGAAANILRNLRQYQSKGRQVGKHIATINQLIQQALIAKDVPTLMGIEGNIRKAYYAAFDEILLHFKMGNRSKQPPLNEVNALVSFGNMMCYALCLDMIYHTQLNPTISFLHEPGTRRYSLALDLAEIFKPILVDRLIFNVLNLKKIQTKDFDLQVNKCLLKEAGKKIFVNAWDERLKKTIAHRTLKKQVSYGQLVKLECYKIAKHVLNMDDYKPFKIWW